MVKTTSNGRAVTSALARSVKKMCSSTTASTEKQNDSLLSKGWSFLVGGVKGFVKNTFVDPAIEIYGMAEKAFTGSNFNYNRIKEKEASVESWIEDNLVTNKTAYQYGETTGKVASYIYGAYNIVKGGKAIYDAGKGIYIMHLKMQK